MGSFLPELRRRHIFRIAGVYIVAAWGVAQVIDLLSQTFALPDWIAQPVLIVLAIGLPFTLLAAWMIIGASSEIEKSSESFKATKTDWVIVSVLVAVLAAIGYQQSTSTPNATESAEAASGVVSDQLTEAVPDRLPNSIAVLPFENLSADPENAFFATGLADEILTSLSKLSELFVTSRTSSFQFRGQDRSIDEIASILGVANILEGSVQRAGNQLRVSAQLVRASDGFQLWSEIYDRGTDDLFAVQEDVAESVASALDVILDPTSRAQMFRSGTRNVEAFEAFQRGQGIYEAVHVQSTSETLFDANILFERAIDLDPQYSTAYLLHADAFSHFLMNGDENPFAPRSSVPEITEVEALESLRADLDNAYETAGDDALRLSMDYTRTVLSDSWERLPTLISAIDDYHEAGGILEDNSAWFLFQIPLGHAEDFLTQVRGRQRTNPLFGLVWVTTVEALLALDRYEEAIAEAERGRNIAGSNPELDYTQALSYALAGDVDEAVSILALGTFPDPVHARTVDALISVLSGREDEGREIVRQIESDFSQHDKLLWVYHQLGDSQEAARLVGEIDSRPLGPQRLLFYLAQHANRLTFSLDDAPNLRNQLAQVGIDETDFQPMPRFQPLTQATNE